MTNRRIALLSLLVAVGLSLSAMGDDGLPEVTKIEDLSRLPANTWTLIGVDAAGDAKNFARVVHAADVGRFYLWGFGGEQPERNRYARYELEQFALPQNCWTEALPNAKAIAWADGKHPPFTIHGRSGPAEGPTLRSVGNQSFNQVAFYEFDGVVRPSPVILKHSNARSPSSFFPNVVFR